MEDVTVVYRAMVVLERVEVVQRAGGGVPDENVWTALEIRVTGVSAHDAYDQLAEHVTVLQSRAAASDPKPDLPNLTRTEVTDPHGNRLVLASIDHSYLNQDPQQNYCLYRGVMMNTCGRTRDEHPVV